MHRRPALVVLAVCLATGPAPQPFPAWRLVTPEGHTGAVTSAAFSPDGRYVVTASLDNSARIWEVASGREVQRLTGHSDAVVSAAFSPDGRLVVTGSWDRTARIWEAATGREVRQLKGHRRAVTSARFSPDGGSIVTSSWDGTAALWSVVSGRLVRQFTGHRAAVEYAAFSPDGASVITASWDSTARIWEAATGREVRQLTGHQGYVVTAEFAPDGRSVVTAAYDNSARIWDAASGREQRRLGIPAIRSSAFSPDGKSVVTATDSGVVQVWDAASGRAVRRFTGSGGREKPATPSADARFVKTAADLTGSSAGMASAVFSPDGGTVVTAGDDGMARVWDAATGHEVQRLTGHAASLRYSAFSPDGRLVATISESGPIRVWEAVSGREVQRFAGHTGWVESAAFSPDGRQAVTAGWDSTARVWDVASGRELQRLRGHTDRVVSAAFSPDGRQVVTGSWDHTARVWDAATGREVRRLTGHTEAVLSAAFSPDGRSVLTAASDATARIWDLASGREVQRFNGDSGVNWYAEYAPDGATVVTAGWSGIARIWDAASGKELRRFNGHSMVSLRVSPDGRSAITGSYGGLAQVWDLASGRELHELAGHTGLIESAGFSPDGRYLLTAGEDGTARVWDGGTGAELFRRIAVDSGDWVLAVPDGRFDGTEGGMRMMHYARNLKTIGLDAFFEKFYTPGLAGLVRAGTPYAGPDIRKGFGLAPSVSIVSPRMGDTLAINATVAVAVKDEGGGAEDIRLYHNGALVGGTSRGVAVTREGCPAGTTCFALELLPGTNTLEATAFSTARIEAERARVMVTVPGTRPSVTLHLVVVGINTYQNPQYSLNYGRPDAKAFVDSLLAGGRGIFSQVSVDTLYDAAATGLAIKAAFRRVAASARPQDLFVFYYAGHGIAESVGDSTRFYLVPSDVTQMSDPEQLARRAIANLQELFDAVPARKKLMLIDACQSGQAIAAFAQRGAAEEQAIARLARASGVFVMSATGSDQQASEVSSLGHGVFTYAWLHAMARDSAGPRERLVGALASEVERTIPELSRRFRAQPQYPIVFRNGQDFPLLVR